MSDPTGRQCTHLLEHERLRISLNHKRRMIPNPRQSGWNSPPSQATCSFEPYFLSPSLRHRACKSASLLFSLPPPFVVSLLQCLVFGQARSSRPSAKPTESATLSAAASRHASSHVTTPASPRPDHARVPHDDSLALYDENTPPHANAHAHTRICGKVLESEDIT